jgi:hypothetical protein
MVNGGSAQEKLYMAAAVIPDLDSIAEFCILTSNADAEYGFYSGGMINVLDPQRNYAVCHRLSRVCL